jgi:hypothetical protein
MRDAVAVRVACLPASAGGHVGCVYVWKSVRDQLMAGAYIFVAGKDVIDQRQNSIRLCLAADAKCRAQMTSRHAMNLN